MENMGTNAPDEKESAKAKKDMLSKLANLSEDSLDAKIAEMDGNELANLAMDTLQLLREPPGGFTDENEYLRFATVYGAACARLEKLEGEKE